MNETLILEKLDLLTKEVQALRAEVRAQQDVTDTAEKLPESSKTSTELAQEFEPFLRQAMSGVKSCFEEVEGQFSADELKILFSRILTSLYAITESLDMLRSGIELRDDMGDIFEIGFLRVRKFLNTLDESDFQAEQIGDLLYTILLNVRTFSDLMNIISPMTEFIKEMEAVLKQTNVIASINQSLDSLQQGNGVLRLTTTVLGGLKDFKLSDEQFEHIRKTLAEINFNDVEPVGPLAMIKQLKDPDFQKTMGAVFMIMQAIGSCIQVCNQQDSVPQKE